MTPHSQIQLAYHANRIAESERQLRFTRDPVLAAILQRRIDQSAAAVNRLNREAVGADRRNSTPCLNRT
jgi:hypothetical protein